MLIHHIPEPPGDLGLEIILDLPDIGELGEGPATEFAPVVDSGDPVGFGGGFLFFPALGIGVMKSAIRRASMIRWVGCPLESSSQCRPENS